MKTLMAIIALIGTLAVPAAANAAEDVIVVYDASGSMWGQIDGVSKIEIARDVMGDLVEGWSSDTNLGLVAYGHRREADCGDIETLIAPGPLDPAAFMSTVERISPKGRTPLSAAVQQAAEVLSYQDNPATVVLISDGVENCEADPCTLASQLADQGVSFTAHVIGFDLETDAHEHLACIADNTGGIFVPAQNAAELQDAIAQVQSVVDLQPVAAAAPEPEPAMPEVTITAPEQATTGAVFEMAWSPTIHPSDFITVVPAGAGAGEIGNHIRAGDEAAGALTAPAEPGLYEVRYVLEEGRRTLASAPIEVVEAAVTVTAPEQATTGAVFEMAWSPTIHPSDFITIVPAGAEAGEIGNHIRAGDEDAGALTAPAEPGLYEVRYVLEEGRRTLASAPIEVVEAAVEIVGPGTIRAESPADVSWSVTIHPSDFITIVPAGAEAGEIGNHIRAGDNTAGELKAPAEPGLYEVRYVLNEGRRTLARDSFEVVAADAPLDDGAGLSVPPRAAPGETITVSWTGGSDSTDQRIALARSDQADFTWIEAHEVGVEKALQITLPEEAGQYEVRYLDVDNRAVLGRAIVEVQ